jgi:hypothetical protein
VNISLGDYSKKFPGLLIFIHAENVEFRFGESALDIPQRRIGHHGGAHLEKFNEQDAAGLRAIRGAPKGREQKTDNLSDITVQKSQ